MRDVLPIIMPMVLLWGLAILASIGEVALTLSIIAAGRGREANPFMRWAIRLSPWLAYTIAIISTALAGAIGFYFLHQGWAEIGYGWMATVLLFRLICIVLNYRVWQR